MWVVETKHQTPHHTNMKTKPWNLAPVNFTRCSIKSSLPSTLSEIRQTAASMFTDAAVVSVEVQAVFGLVSVNRAGEIHIA